MKEDCSNCAYRRDGLEMVAPSVSGTVDWCSKFRMIAYNRCDSFKPNIRSRARELLKNFLTGPDVTIGEECLDPNRETAGVRSASREAIIQEFVEEMDARIARGELTEKEARRRFPQYDNHKQP